MPTNTPPGQGRMDQPTRDQQGHASTPGRDAGDQRPPTASQDRNRQGQENEESPGCGCGSTGQDNTEVSADGDETSIDSDPNPSNPEA